MIPQEYLETRRQALEDLDQLARIVHGYQEIRLHASGAVQQELQEYLCDHAELFRAGLIAIGTDHAKQTIVGVEPSLDQRYREMSQFWQWVHDNKLLGDDAPVEVPQCQADTTIPPDPPHEITGEAVLTYLTELRQWLVTEVTALWSDDAPIDGSSVVMPSRFMLGSFEHTQFVTEQLHIGAKLRSVWLQISDNGNAWDLVNIGASRAKLLFAAESVIKAVLRDPEKLDGGSVDGVGLFHHLLGGLLGGQ